jgi:adenine-specific DNA-methyltransferase
MDFFSGSGTTAAVAMKMKRKFIAIEQMDYIETFTLPRLVEVVKGEQGGISKDVKWSGGGEFVYCELAQANQVFVNAIQSAKSADELFTIWNTMQEKAFLSYRLNLKALDDSKNDFFELSLSNQKEFLIETLDKNMLYVPLSEIDDETYEISDADKALNMKFFG